MAYNLQASSLTDPKPGPGALQVDIKANRAAQKWTRKQLAGRALWEFLGAPLFALCPRPAWVIRRVLLRSFGARIARGVHIFPSARIAIPWNLEIGENAAVGDRAILYNLGMITIGAGATISQYAHLCAGTHDHRSASLPLVKPPIAIGEGAWICADAFVGPGVSIGAYAILGARAVATRDVPDWTISAGNPARAIGRREMSAEMVAS
jgi:putative colanic acid biosynthesis acetyltransferase WcaF